MLGTTNVSASQASMNTLSISVNGTNKLTYNGKNVASLDISLSSLGAAASSHNHNGTQFRAAQGTSGGFTFINDGSYDTGMYSNADGDLYFMRNGVKTPFTNISLSGHTHSYLPLSGGTMTGALNLKNNTWNLAGDDAFYGDNNVAGCFCIKGNNSNTGLAFTKYGDDSTRQILRSDGTTLSIEKNVNVAVALYESDDRVVTKRVLTSGNINQFDRFFTIYNHNIDSTSGVSGLESITSYGMCMTVDGVGTPFQIWFPDNKMLIAKKIKSSTAFNVLQFCRMQSGAPHTDILWCW